MPAITPEFLFDLESNMRTISAQQYQRLSKNLWWTKVAKRMPSGSKKERVNWLLDTARIERKDADGQVTFEDIVSQTTEFENLPASAGLKVKKPQLEDLDGNGVDLAAHWARQMGAYAAYWPQKMIAKAIRDNGTTYDGKAMFAVDHFVNGLNSDAGTFANRFTGSSSGAYPGALPIHAFGAGAVTLDVAVANLGAALAYIATIPMPSGEDPRQLAVRGIMGPPAMRSRLQQITNAKFIAQAAASGGGSGDVEALIADFAFGEPIIAPELAAAFGGSDTSYYLLVEEITSDELGALVYVDREPFQVVYHGPQTSAELAKIREFQWTTAGRNVVGYGHPYNIFRGDAT